MVLQKSQQAPNALSLAVLLAISSTSSFAQIESSNQLQYQAAPVVVTATRTQKDLYETASSIGVVTQQQIEETSPTSFVETLTFVPNVDVSGVGNPINSRISIRGSDANQITYLIDGMRQDQNASSGDHPIGIFIDPELIKQVEVRRGGGSALYGNGGIGGTVAITTKMAGDFLKPDENFGAMVKGGYAGESKEWQKSAYVFGRQGMWDALVAYTRRDGESFELSDGNGRLDDDADYDYTGLMAKLSALPNEDTLVSLTYNYDEANQFWRDEGYPVDYSNEQHRLTGQFEYSHGDLIDFKGGIQYTKAEFSYESIVSNPVVTGARGYNDDFESISLSLQNTSRLIALGSHAVTYGLDYNHAEQNGEDYTPFDERPVDSLERPDSKGQDFGVFIQDEYAINKYVSVIPVLRYSWFERKSNAGYEKLTDSQVNPGFTLTLTPNHNVSFWASVNSGFRPPILDELYYSTRSIFPGYFPDAVVDANPDLKPEKSINYEIGMNAVQKGLFTQTDSAELKLSLFYDEVEDFINVDMYTDDNYVDHYYTENIGEVVRKGVELSGHYQVGQFDLQAVYGLVHAQDQETDKRIDSVTPQSFKLRLGYTVPKWDLTTWYRLRWTDVADSLKGTQDGRGLTYDDFTTHALGLTWKPTVAGVVDFSASVSVENLTDEEYRYSNGSYGYGRAVRAWVSARF